MTHKRVVTSMKYVPNLTLLDSWSDVKQHLYSPASAVFEFDNKKLIYCGTKHSADKSFQLLDKCFSDFDIDCVVTEYSRKATLTPNAGKIETKNELEYAALVGMRAGIDVVFADTDKTDWIADLIALSPDYAHKMETFFMLNDAYLYKKTFNENFSINRAIKNVTHKFWNDDFPKPMNEPEFKKYFLQNFGLEITDDNISDMLIKHPNWNEPNKQGNLINKVHADINLYSRDPYMIKCIFHAVNTHKCVLAAFGAGHFDDARRVLEHAFGTPKITHH